MDHHAAVVGEVAGQQDVGLAFIDRGGEAHAEAGDGKAALAFVARGYVGFAAGVVELFARRVDEHRLVGDFAVIEFGTRELEGLGLHLGRRVFDQQHGEAVRRDLADRREHHAVAVRIDEGRVDPVGARRRKLAQIEFARGQQRLAVLAVDGVAVHVGVGEHVVGAQRLDLGDGVVEGAGVPQADVVEDRLVGGRVDGGLGVGLELDFLELRFDAEGGARGVDVSLDVGALERDFVGPHIERADQAGSGEIHHQGRAPSGRRGTSGPSRRTRRRRCRRR